MAVSPRLAARRRDAGHPGLATPWSVLGAATGCAVVLITLYAWTFGSLAANPSEAAGSATARVTAPSPGATSEAAAQSGWIPGLAGIRLQRGFGIGVFVSQPDDGSSPGTLVVRGGVLAMTLVGVEGEGLVQGAFPFILAATMAFLVAVCLHPPARALGGRASFAGSFRLSLVFCAYVIALVTLLSLVAALTLIHGLGLTGRAYLIAHAAVTQVPMLALLPRSYITAFSEHFGIRVWRVAAAALLGLLLTLVVAPVVLFPAVYVTVRFQPVLDLLLVVGLR